MKCLTGMDYRYVCTKNADLHRWWSQWNDIRNSEQTMKALDSKTCGHYALIFLKAKARGSGFQDFLAQ